MAKIEKYSCDIKSCTNEASHKQVSMQVIFKTEQNEGRPANPYLYDVKIDMCDECLKKLLKSGKYIVAYGAMGYNDYHVY